MRVPLTDWLALRATAGAGYFYGFGNGSQSGVTGGNALLSAGIGALFLPWPSLSLLLDANYQYGVSFLQTINVHIGATYAFSPAKRSTPALQKEPETGPKPGPLNSEPQGPSEAEGRILAIKDVSFGNVFPIFQAYYDTHSIGKLTLVNTGDSPVTDVNVALVIRQYMDAPKDCATISALNPGEERVIDLFALFNAGVLQITQDTKTAAEIQVTYTFNGRPGSLTKVETLPIYHRNAMTWDDDRKAAAFVTPLEPVVLTFSNNINAFVKNSINRAIDKNLQIAMALHDALRLYGISYVSNPLTSYAEVSKNKLAVDTLKFPRETLSYKSGDCSDLSILYCALLESVQIETAFITIPGHIFIALALKSSPDETRAVFSHSDEMIFRDGRVWVPVEVTERDEAFLTAWQEGAKEWQEYNAKGQADFYLVREAWKTYPSVGFPGIGAPPVLPEAQRVVHDFQGDLSRLLDREMSGRLGELQAAVTKTHADPRAVNSLGVLYARYDLRDEAEAQFQKVLAKLEYVPCLLNMGNLFYIESDLEKALSYFGRAYALAPQNPRVLLSYARVNNALQNYYAAQKTYGELKKIDPALAQRYRYLELKGEESTRAAEIAGERGAVEWDEQ